MVDVVYFVRSYGEYSITSVLKLTDIIVYFPRARNKWSQVRADVLQGVMPLSARHPSSVSVAIHHPHTPSTTVMEWFREGSVLSGAFREHGGVEVMACFIRTAA